MTTGHSAKTHKAIRKKQNKNLDSHHHPLEKIIQLKKFKNDFKHADVLEVFAGKGNLTRFYNKYSKSVIPMTKEKFGNSFDSVYKFRAGKKKFDIIDIDSYGYPDLFFPIVFELFKIKQKCLLIFTFPIVGVNCLNGIQEQHFITFWKSARPTIGDVTGVLTDLALRNWNLISLKDVVKIKRIYRFVFEVNRVKATDFCNVKNR